MMIPVNQIAAETKDKAFGEGAVESKGEVLLLALQHAARASSVASTHLSDESWLARFASYSPPHVKSDPKPSSEIGIME